MTHDVCGRDHRRVQGELRPDRQVWTRTGRHYPDHYIFTADTMATATSRSSATSSASRHPYYYIRLRPRRGDPSPTRTHADPLQGRLPQGLPKRPRPARRGAARHRLAHCTAGRSASSPPHRQHDAGFVLGTGKLWSRCADDEIRLPRQIPPYLTARTSFSRHRRDLRQRGDLQGDVLRGRRHREPVARRPHDADKYGHRGRRKTRLRRGREDARLRRKRRTSDVEVYMDDPDAQYCYVHE